MEIQLSHGRDDPEMDMDSMGYEGPTLRNVEAIRQMYVGMTRVRFTATEARDAAMEKTGWPIWDDTALEILHRGDLIETRENKEISRFYGDFILRHQDALGELEDTKFMVRRARNELQSAIRALPRIP